MAKLTIVKDADGKFYSLSFKCPGCVMPDGHRLTHQVKVVVGHENIWPHNGNDVLISRGETYLPAGMEVSPHSQAGHHWCFNGSMNAPTFSPSILVRMREHVCHSFVENGMIQFLADCTHSLAGTTVPLLDVENDHG